MPANNTYEFRIHTRVDEGKDGKIVRFCGTLFIWKALMEPSETYAHLVMLGFYIIQKVLGKVNR